MTDPSLLKEIPQDALGGQAMANGRSELYKQGVKRVVSIWTPVNTCKRIIVSFGVGVVAGKGRVLNT